MELRESDIENIIAKSRLFGKYMVEIIRNNAEIVYENFQTRDRLKEGKIEDKDVSDDLTEEEKRDICLRRCRELTIVENCKNIDMDRLLLMIGYRMIEDLERGKTNVKSSEGGDLYEVSKKDCIGFFRQIVLNILEMVDKDTKAFGIETENGNIVDYSAEELALDSLRFQDEKYISKRETEQVICDLLNGRVLLQDVPEGMRKVLWVEKEKYYSCMINSIPNFVYTIDNNIRSKDEIYEMLGMMNKIPSEILNSMISTGILSFNEAISFFEQGKISLEQMREIDIGEEEARIACVDNKVRELYFRSLELENDMKRQDEYIEIFGLFSRYVGLYRTYNFEGKSDDEINNKSSDMISMFEDVLNDNTLQELYQYGVISLEASISWGGNLLDMLSKNNIKTTDLKNLYANGTISIEQIKKVLRYKDIPNDEKLDLIYGTFDGESKEEADIRNELIQLLSGVEEYRDTYNRTGNKRAKGEGTKKRELVTDPQARWKFISLIDKDYSKRFLPEDKGVYDGHRVFFFPNKNSIFIEKMYERRKGRIVSAYAKATYIMDANVFFENVDDIIIQGAINRKFLVGMSDAIRIDHNSAWARKIMEYYNISIENREYTEEHIMKFKEAEERIKRSREERE